MRGETRGKILAALAIVLLVVSAFFAKQFVLYDFHMNASDYRIAAAEGMRPAGADTGVWISFGEDREVQYGLESGRTAVGLRIYAKFTEGAGEITEEIQRPDGRLGEESFGNLILALSGQELDVDGDGVEETVYDFARADFGPHAFEPYPIRFSMEELPLELCLFNRREIQVYWRGELLREGEVEVTSSDGSSRTYTLTENGCLDGLPIRDIRNGFTVTYIPDGQGSGGLENGGETVYRMYYALEDYPYFSQHFWKAHLPLVLTFALSALGIILFQTVRNIRARKTAEYAIYSRETAGLHKNSLRTKTSSRFLLIRWSLLLAAMFFWTYAGKLLGQGQRLNEIAVPVFACPFNLDQVVETPCYYLSHLPDLFTRFGEDFPVQNLAYAAAFFVTLLFCIVFLGKIFCGFLCPAGLLQDMMDKLREVLHIRPITVTDRMNRILQPVKWAWIILFLGFAFAGGDFCDICPLKVFATAQGGFWTNLYLGGFLAVVILVGSFFIRRFWCLICPMGYLMGLFYRFNLFHLKKDCTACTECGACYDACPMRIKQIYKEREKELVQNVDCLMCGECIRQCPENDALSMTFCGKKIFTASRKTFLSKYKHPVKMPKQEGGDGHET